MKIFFPRSSTVFSLSPAISHTPAILKKIMYVLIRPSSNCQEGTKENKKLQQD